MEISRTIYAAKAEYDVVYTPDIVFARRETGDLKLQLLSLVPPVADSVTHPLYANVKKKEKTTSEDTRRFPLVVDVPGSGWSGAEGYAHVPRMTELARQGFVVACIAYRGTFKDDVRYPAAVQDTKEAIRFLRANARRFHIDCDRVSLLGDSSGGHTVLTAALTENEERFRIGEHREMSEKVNACVAFYAPVDLKNLVADRIAEGKTLRPGEGEVPFEARELFQEDFLHDPDGMLTDASPIHSITADKRLPAFLFLQGDEDPIIPMAQGLRFCERLRACGARAEFVKIAAGGHGTGCWGKEAMQTVSAFLKAYND